MKLIDKDALVAEITKRVKECEIVERDTPSSAIFGLIQAYKNVLSFIDTLEVKEVDLDKEEERIWKDFNMAECRLSKNDLEKISKHFFELGLSVSNKAQKGK